MLSWLFTHYNVGLHKTIGIKNTNIHSYGCIIKDTAIFILIFT